METIINALPEYKPNQVLTETSLNATSSYLEQQERLTRFGLTQTGIIENLEYRVFADKIVIEEGFGITKEGHFMAHHYKAGSVEYRFLKSYAFTNKATDDTKFLKELKSSPFSEESSSETTIGSISFYELLTNEQADKEPQSEVISISSLEAPNYKIVLFMEITRKEQDQCSPTSCDTGGSLREYRTVPLLVIDNDDTLFPKINAEQQLKNQIRLKRLSNLSQIFVSKDKLQLSFYQILVNEYSRLNYQNTTEILNKLREILLHWDFPLSLGEKFKTINLASLTVSVKALEQMQQSYIPRINTQDFPYNYGFISQLKPTSSIPKASANFLAKSKEMRKFILNKNQSGIHPNATIYFQQYSDFCNDLEAAINELVLEFNSFILKHSSSYNLRLQRFLVLGSKNRYNLDPYRYYAIQNFANEDFRENKEMIFRHFKRICVLVDKFKTGFLQLPYKKEIKIIPSKRGNYPLEERSIPYYYQQDMELEDAWIVSKNKTLKTNIYQYRDHKAPYNHFAYNIGNYNFIRVEGILGPQDVFEISGRGKITSPLDNIKGMINNFNIPMKYKVFDIDKANLDWGFELSDLEHTGGTKMGGTLIIFMAKVNNTPTVVADFQMYS